MSQNKINEAWVTAPYRVDFLLAVPRGPRKQWSRKRRLKWIRRETRRIMRSFRPPPVHDFDLKDFDNGDFKCPACEGDITSPHSANCNHAPGN